MGCFGLDSDARALVSYMREKLLTLQESEVEPEIVARIISDYVYHTPALCTTIVVGLSKVRFRVVIHHTFSIHIVYIKHIILS